MSDGENRFWEGCGVKRSPQLPCSVLVPFWIGYYDFCVSVSVSFFGSCAFVRLIPGMYTKYNRMWLAATEVRVQVRGRKLHSCNVSEPN